MRIIDAYCTPGTERDTVLAAADLLRSLQQAQVAAAVIAPQDREIAVDNVGGNERIRHLAETSAGRLIPACAANPWRGRDGCQIVRNALSHGAKMLVLAPALQGFCLGDEVTDPLLRLAAEHRLPVYVHTGPHSSSTPTQLILLAAEHPQTRFILGHCGSTDYSHDMPAVFRAAPANVSFELSLVRPWALPAYAQHVDESRLIFGSSAPRNDLRFELEQFDLSWPIERHPGTYGGNLEKLLAEVVA